MARGTRIGSYTAVEQNDDERRCAESVRGVVIIERDPSDHYARFVLGRTLERQGRPAEALPHLRMASVMHPSEEYEQTLRRVSAKVH